MEKPSTLGETIIAPSNFSSEIEVNLDGTNENDLFVRMTERAWVTLSKELVNKNAIINPQNKDDKCFLWCVLRALNPTKDHPERIE